MGSQGRVPTSLSAFFLEAVGFPLEILDLVGQFFYDYDQFLVGGGELIVVCRHFLKH